MCSEADEGSCPQPVLTLLIVVRSLILSHYSAVLMISVIQYDIGTYVAFVSLHIQIQIFTISVVS